MMVRPSQKQLLLRVAASCALFVVTLLVMTVVRENRMQSQHQRGTGLASVAGAGPVAFNDPAALWQSRSLMQTAASALAPPERMRNRQLAPATVSREGGDPSSERKIVSVARLSLIVKDPRDTVERIRHLTANARGYTAKLQIEEKDGFRNAAMSIRVPASSLDQVRSELRKLSQRVESDSLEADEVGKRYVDYEASLRNSRAEEKQYLAILQRAQKVSEILEVSEKLAEVRGEIDKTEGELKYLQQQIAMASVTVMLRVESDAEIATGRWRPQYTLRRSFRNGLDNVAGYAEAMASLLMNLPAILLWAGTIVLMMKFGWRLLHWLWRGVKTSKAQLNATS